MKDIHLHWKPIPGPKRVLMVDIELGKEHPIRKAGKVHLAILKVTDQATELTPFPRFESLPQLTREETDLILSHARVYWSAHFSALSCNTIHIKG